MHTNIIKCFVIVLINQLYLTGIDYKFTAPMNITISAGDIYTTFSITIYDDNIVEENETFCLFIGDILSDECSSFSADPPHVTVTIVDEGIYICM